MLIPFFALAAQSPSRQSTFRRTVIAHVVVLAAASLIMLNRPRPQEGAPLFGTVALIMGIVEGATLLGWRLTQLPKSQALEFLLVSPLRPSRFFLVEALVGMARLALVTLSGLPFYAWLASKGFVDPLDLAPLLIMPWTWGAITGVGLTVWAYEPVTVRRWGERLLIGLVVFYLLVGVLAGENLKAWLAWLPEEGQRFFFNAFLAFHRFNPFQLMAAWMQYDIAMTLQPVCWLQVCAVAILILLLARSASRLQNHFHELHYVPQIDPSGLRRPPMSERPLSWWSTRRVMRYSGRINFWLIGGFGVFYSLYTVAGPYWPSWLGKAVFVICDNFGGLSGLAAALVVLATVPAAFQYGLWDSNAQDRCRRLELLLLTPLCSVDYWDAAAAAAVRRGRGYFAVAVMLWVAAWASGQAEAAQIAGAAAAGVLIWGLYFALGFRAFSRGMQANGLGMILTLGLPLLAYAIYKADWPYVAALIPPASVQLVLNRPPTWAWALGPLLAGAVGLGISRYSLSRCDRELRRWYEGHHGSKVMA
ncbi:MAG: hypothetical protein ACJ8FY_11495 [Gemmataceae bacterium]